MTAVEAAVAPVYPAWCPAWCDRADHLAYIEDHTDDDGTLTITPAQAAVHHRYVPGPVSLPEIRNSVDHGIERPGGGQWELRAEQYPHPTLPGGYSGPPLFVLALSESSSADGARASISLTSSEARRLAAALTWLADKVELSE